MLPDRDRLHRRAASPRLVSLHRALGRLGSTVTIMNTGAHPDDEHNEMLATLRHQHGARIVVACSTRGEGGQSVLGPERLGALGVIRSREMEEAARVIDADIAWLGHGPDDSVHDFGFSKSGSDTLSRWGEERIIDRLVRAYRQFRPDIIIPTFLDVPGQHGHHRAMTEAAERAIALAADAAYEIEGLSPWRVAKFYLPAWSGGGDTYDDEVPPPPATTLVTARGVDAATGMSFDRLGEVSRAYHASQNMGFWRFPPHSTWSLHLVGGSSEPGIFAGLPARLADLGESSFLAKADAAIDRATASFPEGDAIFQGLVEARSAIVAALPTVAEEHAHRLLRKQEEIDAAMALAAGIDISVALSEPMIVPGGSVDIIAEVQLGMATAVHLSVHADPSIAASPRDAQIGGRSVIALTANADAKVTNAFRPDWQSLGGNGLAYLEVNATINGETIRFMVDTEEPLQIDPEHSLSIAPEALIVPLGGAGTYPIAIKGTVSASMSVTGTKGVVIRSDAAGLVLAVTPDLEAGRHSLPLTIDGAQAFSITPIAYPHIGHTRFAGPQSLDILSLDLKVPDTQVGYVGAGSDRVGLWLERMGAQVTALDSDAIAGDLGRFDTIVIGIFAFGARPDLAAATRMLHEWVRKGGHLVTLYHRPSDAWHPDSTPPLPLRIGSPSLRWRVTNPAAPVTILEPGHTLLSGPNTISAADFEHWDKERGLYFAASWDDAYVPLLALNDEGEKPLKGSLLSAAIGNGRHTHTSLALHHQMDKLVPGAFRIMANLLQTA
ncbi:PIG-L family deacetylase [Devosia sp. CAU 1758]